jgi:hypothetical protein
MGSAEYLSTLILTHLFNVMAKKSSEGMPGVNKEAKDNELDLKEC